MARKTKTLARKAKRGKRVLWTASDLKFMRQNAGKMSLRSFAKALKRSAPAVRFKASEHKISLRLKKK